MRQVAYGRVMDYVVSMDCSIGCFGCLGAAGLAFGVILFGTHP